MRDGEAGESIGRSFAAALLLIKAQAKFNEPSDIPEGGAPYNGADHVASRFCERSTASSALIAFAASVGVGSRVTLAIGPP